MQCALLFLNGIFALSLELIWCKRLEQLSGVGLFAVTETISCFLLGLALGGWAGSKLCNSSVFWRKSKKYLVRLQAITVIACLLFSILIFSPLSYSLIEAFGSTVLQLMCALLILPAFGIGMLLAVTVVSFRGNTATLYTYNLFGSFVGAALTVFWFMPAAGLWRPALAVITIGLFALCVLLRISFASLAPGDANHSTDADSLVSLASFSPTPFLPIKYGVLLVGISGFAAIALEIIYVRIANLIFGAGIYALALVLIVYLLSSTAGACAAAYRRSSLRRNSFTLIFGPLIAGVYLYRELFLLNNSPWIYLSVYKFLHASAFNNFAAHLLTCSLLLLLLEFVPIFMLSAFFIAVLNSSLDANKASNIGYLLCSNNLGSIAGAWTAGFILIPLLSTIAESGMQRSIAVLICVMSVLSLCALAGSSQVTRLQRVAVISIALLLLVAPAYAIPKWNAALFSLNVPRLCQNSNLLDKLTCRHDIELAAHKNQLEFYREGINSTVSVFSNIQNNIRYLKIDGLIEGSIPIDWSHPSAVPTDLSTHLLLAQLPLMTAPARPLNVCLIGYGTGTTANAILSASNVRALEIIELEKCVLEAARLFKYPADQTSFAIAVTDHFEDARSYLLRSHTINDVIICQPSEPWVGGTSNLFTKQYWQICRKRLAPDGVLCQWVQLYGLTPSLLADICRTFILVFPNSAVIHEPGAGEIFLLASNNPSSDITQVFMQRCRHLNQTGKLHPELILTSAQLKQWCHEVALTTHDSGTVTDDSLLIEYAMPSIEQDPETCIIKCETWLTRYLNN